MLKLNSELRAVSRTTLSGNWMMAALATLVYLLIAGGVSSIPVAGKCTCHYHNVSACVWICNIVSRLVP